MSHSPQAAFTVSTELRLPGKFYWKKENLTPSFCGQIPRILNGKSSAPVEGVLKGREGIGRGRNRGRGTERGRERGREGGKKGEREGKIYGERLAIPGSLDGRHGNWIFSTP